jgi:hypothetical protein
MCGIVGMVTSNTYGFNASNRKLFEQLLWADTLRGSDSTGIFGVTKTGNVDYMKAVGNPTNILEHADYKDFHENIYDTFHMVVGHNRKSTRGATTDENAHPFIEGNTILVHNGTLTNHAALTDQVVEVDSHAILHSIVERGYEETLKELQGAFTLVWYDAADKTLRIIRNNERPMYIASTVGAWYFASEEQMLEWILERDDVKIKDMTCCKPGMLYSFKLDDKENMWYQPHELWSPPKSTVTFIPAERKEEEKEIKERKGDTYSNTDFLIGTPISVVCKAIHNVKPNMTGLNRLAIGHWFYDADVSVKIWTNDEELEALASASDDSDIEENLVFKTKITAVMQSKGKFTLICKEPVPYEVMLDLEKNELSDDLFMFTNAKCSWCNTDVTLTELQKGIFKYESADDFEICCPDCAKSGGYC